jgi:hypothetical protein
LAANRGAKKVNELRIECPPSRAMRFGEIYKELERTALRHAVSNRLGWGVIEPGPEGPGLQGR